MKVKKNVLVSILLLNYNGYQYTKECIESILNSNYKNIEILILDNGSLDNEGDKLRQTFSSKITVIKKRKNIGYARGMNELIAKCRGKYIMIMNNDMVVRPDFLDHLVDCLESDKDVGACCPKIRDLKKKSMFEYSSAAGGMLDIFWYPFARGRIFSSIEEDRGQYDKKVDVCWTGVIFIRRSVVKKIGVFDPIYFHNMEDIDLCIRIYGIGYRIVFVPKSLIYHYGGLIIAKNYAYKMFYVHRNHLILILKFWHLNKLLLLFLPRVIMDIISVFHYTFSGYPKIALSVLRAYIAVIPLTPDIIKSRRKLRKHFSYKNFSAMPIYRGSIVYDYFVRKIRKYSQMKIRESYNKQAMS